MAAHIDLMPTLLDACGVKIHDTPKMDGISLMPLLNGNDTEWSDRYLYFQWHRGDVPRLYENCAVRSQRYKLVNGKELYDLAVDPGETDDISTGHPVIVNRMRKAYEEWMKDVSSPRGYVPTRIHLGTKHENPAILTRQDWRGPNAEWTPTGLGYWEVTVEKSANFEIMLQFDRLTAPGEVHFRLGDASFDQKLAKNAESCIIGSICFKSGDGRLEAWTEVDGRQVGMNYVTVRKL